MSPATDELHLDVFMSEAVMPQTVLLLGQPKLVRGLLKEAMHGNFARLLQVTATEQSVTMILVVLQCYHNPVAGSADKCCSNQMAELDCKEMECKELECKHIVRAVC